MVGVRVKGVVLLLLLPPILCEFDFCRCAKWESGWTSSYCGRSKSNVIAGMVGVIGRTGDGHGEGYAEKEGEADPKLSVGVFNLEGVVTAVAMTGFDVILADDDAEKPGI